MPLDWRNVRVPFGGGIDTKTDPKQVIPGQLLTLENGVFHETGTIRKRNGFESPYSDDTVDSAIITAGNAIYRHDKELLITGLQKNFSNRIGAIDGRKVLSHGPDENEWKTIGDRDPLRLEVQPIIPASTVWECPDVALTDSNKYIGYTYLSLQDPGYAAGVTEYARAHFTIKELATDVTLIDDYVFTQVPLNASDVGGVHIVGIGTKFYIWIAVPSLGRIYVSIIDTTNISAAPTITQVCDDLDSDMIWDVCTATHPISGICSVLAYKESAGNFPEVRWVDATGNPVQIRIGNKIITNAITVYEEYDRLTTTKKILVAYQILSDGHIEGTTFNADTTVYAGWDYTIYNADAGLVQKMTGCKDDGADNDNGWPNRSYLRLFVEVKGTTTRWWRSYVLTIIYEFDGTDANNQAPIRHARLASKAWNYENKPRVWVVHQSTGVLYNTGAQPDHYYYSQTLQNTYFLRSPGDHINYGGHFRTDARCLGGEAGESYKQHISAVVCPVTANYYFAAKRQEQIIQRSLPDGSGEAYDPDSMDSIVCIGTTFNQLAQPAIEMGPTVQTGGGFVGDADGRFQELGFHLYPMIIKIAANGGSGAAVEWYYTAVYEWMDREGQRHQSAPSLPVKVSCKADDHVIIEVMTLTYGDYEKLSNTRIIIYRTVTLGSVFYRLPDACCAVNSPTVYTTFCYDQSPTPGTAAVTDANLVYGATIYTGSLVNGVWDVVENICPPASSIMDIYQDRIILVPDEDRTSLWFSKIKQHEVGVSFSDTFTKRITDGGEITALAVMDGRQLVFKQTQIRAFSGDGPIDTGVGSFGEDYLITADVGCCDRASVVWTDKGIMFKSLKGIYLLGRNLQVTYIGAPVEDYNQYHVLKAELVETKNQVRFLLDGANMLVYDYLANQWSVFKPATGLWGTVGSAMWQNQYVMIKSDGTVYLEGTDFTDGTIYIPLTIETAWIKLNSLQGYQRVRWASLLGEVFGQCNLTVDLYINYVNTSVQTIPLAVNAALVAAVPAQLRIKPKLGTQKSQAIKFKIVDSVMAGWGGTQEGFAMSEILLECGIKKGVMRQGAIKTR